MPTMRIDGTELHYEDKGSGPVLAMVNWGTQEVFDRLAGDFRVAMVHQRGQGLSPPWPRMSLADWMLDLEAFIMLRDLAPCHVFGVSGGGASAFQLAVRRPDLLKSMVVHEPAMTGILEDDPATKHLYDEHVAIKPRAAELANGENPADGVRYFMAHVSPAAWAALTPEEQDARVEMAAPMLIEQMKTWDPDPGFYSDIDPALLARVELPVLLTYGTDTEPLFSEVAKKMAAALPRCELRALPGQAHSAPTEHADAYAAMIAEFVRAND